MTQEQEEGVEQTIPTEEKESLVEKWKEHLSGVSKRKWYLMTLVGIFLLILASRLNKMEKSTENEPSNMGKSGEVSTSSQYTDTEDHAYTTYIEQKLKTVLSTIEGVGEAEVFVTLKASSEKIIDKEYSRSDDTLEETDSGGGTRKDRQLTYEENTVLIGEGNGMPYVLQEMAPEIEGILIVAEGADSPVIAEQITDAMSALFGVSPHKIRVLKKESS